MILLRLAAGACLLIVTACDSHQIVPNELEYLVPDQFGTLEPISLEQGIACVAVAFHLLRQVDDLGPSGLKLAHWSRGTEFQPWNWFARVEYAPWQEGLVSHSFADSHQSFSLALGCDSKTPDYIEGNPGDGGSVGRLWSEAELTGYDLYYSSGRLHTDNPRYDDYFIGFIPSQSIVIVSQYFR